MPTTPINSGKFKIHGGPVVPGAGAGSARIPRPQRAADKVYEIIKKNAIKFGGTQGAPYICLNKNDQRQRAGDHKPEPDAQVQNIGG